MPLSEFLRLAIEKLESSKKQKSCPPHISSSRKESNMAELVWENGPVHHSLSPRFSNGTLGHESMVNSGTSSLDNGFEFSSIVSNSNGSKGHDAVLGDVASDLNLSHFWRAPNLANKPNVPMVVQRPQTEMETGVNEPKEDGGASSVGSGNSGERVCDEQTHNLKRKSCDVESDGVKVRGGGGGSKRRRSAHVHNLSERRRRDRINEKMRALQQLIPNCNKADKASMLDDAIQYLKNLQHQAQLMSSMMMFNPGSQLMYPAPMAIGMGMSLQHPVWSFGVHTTVPKPPSTPWTGCHCGSRISSLSSVPNASEDPTKNNDSQKMLNAGASTSINRLSDQLQTTNEVRKRS